MILPLLLLLRVVSADLPVHCLLHDVAGEWDFEVGPPVKDGLLPACGHHIPNNVVSVLANNRSGSISLLEAKRYRVNLTENIKDHPLRHLSAVGDIKAGTSSHESKKQSGVGFWTMVFDEGFEVRTTDGLSLFSHFYFEALDGRRGRTQNGDRWDAIAKYFGRDSKTSILPPEGDIYACHCDQTSYGWWHKHTSSGTLESGCFRATKVNKNAPELRSTMPKEPTSFVRLIKQKRSSRSSRTMHVATKHGQDEEGMRSLPKTGSLRSGSKGAPSTLINTKAHVHSSTQSVLALEDFFGNAADPTFVEKEVFRTAGLVEQQSPRATPATSLLSKLETDSSSEKLPKAWDWRAELADLAPEGVDDLSDQFDQGNCGSCYAFSATNVLQMRFRIRLLQEHGLLYPLELSWKSATKCSPYTEGCEGGFAYLSFKHAAEIGLPMAECDEKERPEDLDATCDWSCYRNNSFIFYAKDYGQTGGFAYGADEKSIMREIHDNGPVIFSFSTTAVPEFVHNNGHSSRNGTDVMTRFLNKKVPREPSSVNHNILPWRYTTHSILAVGWGEEKTAGGETEKYWLVRNSWGKDWGDQGYAKIRRGHNDAAIETSAPWVEPDMSRLPPGFLEIARKHDKQRRQQIKSSKNGSPKAHMQPLEQGDRQGGKPAYCKMRPNSPDCK